MVILFLQKIESTKLSRIAVWLSIIASLLSIVASL